MAGGGFTIFNSGQFRIGLGDANRDGRLDFDFGLRGQSFGAGPFGWGHQGGEIGLNTQRGLYAGGDYSNNNYYGSQAGFGRVFQDGGIESGQVGRDAWGNFGTNYTNTSPYYYYNQNSGGNVFTGNYYGNQTDVNAWGWGQDSVAGNAWTGQQAGLHSRGNAWGGQTWGSYNPGFVPPFAMASYQGGGAFAAGRFMGF